MALVVNKGFLSIDPGVRFCPAAEFNADGVLVGLFFSRVGVKVPVLAAVRRHAEFFADLSFKPVICEAPTARGGRTRATTQDLMDLSLLAGQLGTFFVTPETWKGSVPKEVHQPKILAALRPEERTRLEDDMKDSKIGRILRHNVIDAVGIGLWYAGRLKR